MGHLLHLQPWSIVETNDSKCPLFVWDMLLFVWNMLLFVWDMTCQ